MFVLFDIDLFVDELSIDDHTTTISSTDSFNLLFEDTEIKKKN